METMIQPLSFNPAALNGLSERIVTSHHRNNYGGAVKRLGAIRAALSALDLAGTPGFVLNGLKREELIAANSMRLHEVHFDSLGGDGVLPEGPLATAIAAAFGSVTRWRDEFIALGKALGGGSGWVLLSWSPREARLLNPWASDHAHALADGVPLLALDMYEHAYHLDFGADAAAWVDTFMRNLAWARVAERFESAAAQASHSFSLHPPAAAADAATARLDVRRAPIVRAAATRVPGALWRDPAAVDAWAAEFAGRRVNVYCVHGHGISRFVTARLRVHGVQASCIEGGIEAWTAAGLPLEPNPEVKP
jgi:Fe-Mn family superoxide dismutase